MNVRTIVLTIEAVVGALCAYYVYQQPAPPPMSEAMFGPDLFAILILFATLAAMGITVLIFAASTKLSGGTTPRSDRSAVIVVLALIAAYFVIALLLK